MSFIAKNEISSYGVRGLRGRNAEIKRLKRIYSPYLFGFRIWTSSWLLIDYFKHRRLRRGAHVMDIGCGWGLAGIFCAKEYGALVTSVDIDAEVFPYLNKHAQINGVNLSTLNKGLDDLTNSNLKEVDVLIGAEICFWPSLRDSVRNLVARAFESGVQRVVIADPGRPPFCELGEFFVNQGQGQVLPWIVDYPHHIEGSILQVMSPAC